MDAKEKKGVIDAITKQTIETENLLGNIADSTKSIKISGRTRDEWWAFFRLTISPDNANPAIIRVKLADLSAKWFTAARAHSHAKAEMEYISTIIGQKQVEAKRKIRDSNQAIGSGNLNSFSNLAIADLRPIEKASSITVEFWGGILEYLANVLKILNQLNFADSNEAKLQPPGA